jgi:hypothetical protein
MCQDGRSAEVKLQANFSQPSASHGGTKASFILGVEHQESSAARSNQFASERSLGSRQFVHFVNKTAAHSWRAFFLVLPVNVHQFGKLA